MIYKIGDFAYWDSSDDIIKYVKDNVKKLERDNLIIVKHIAYNKLKNDNYISASQIASDLERPDFKLSGREAIKKAIQRIRKDPNWKSVIDSSPNGYSIIMTQTDLSEIPNIEDNIDNSNYTVLEKKPAQSDKNEKEEQSKGAYGGLFIYKIHPKNVIVELTNGSKESFAVLLLYKYKHNNHHFVLLSDNKKKDHSDKTSLYLASCEWSNGSITKLGKIQDQNESIQARILVDNIFKDTKYKDRYVLIDGIPGMAKDPHDFSPINYRKLGKGLNKTITKKPMKIVDSSGDVEEVDVILAFEFKDDKKEYVIYTKNETNDSGDVTLYASRIDRSSGSPVLKEIDGKDWDRVKDVMWELGGEKDISRPNTSFFDDDGMELL